MWPESVHIITSRSEIATAQVKVESAKGPRRQFLPDRGIGAGLPAWLGLIFSRPCLAKGPFSNSVTFHTFMCLVPTVTRLFPHHVIAHTFVVHLFVECSFTPPVLEFMDQTNRKP